LKDLELKNKNSANLQTILYQLFTNEIFRTEKISIFFNNFLFFYGKNCHLFFDSILEIYQVPIEKINDENLVTKIKDGIVQVLSEGFSVKNQFQEVYLSNKTLQNSAKNFISNLDNEFHKKSISQAIESCFSLSRYNWIESSAPLKLKQKNFVKDFKPENFFLGNFDLFQLDPLFLSVNLYYLCKYNLSEIPICELYDNTFSTKGIQF
jgi:hypothetical protein